MKFLLVLIVLLAYSFAAVVPHYEQIAKYYHAPNSTGSRIINGSLAVANQFPHQVSVRSPVGNGFATCGGSLISTGWVLSAAHCTVGRSQFILRFGSLNLLNGGTSQNSFVVINHPNFNPTNLNNDICLLAIPTPVTISAAITPVRLAKASQFGTSWIDYQATVSGWGENGPGTGVSQVLQWVHTRVISNEQCANVYGTSVVMPHVICTEGYTTAIQGACGGDSGGPLTIMENGTTTHIGVVSFAHVTGCNAGFPNGYMRTSHFIHWIQGHTDYLRDTNTTSMVHVPIVKYNGTHHATPNATRDYMASIDHKTSSATTINLTASLVAMLLLSYS